MKLRLPSPLDAQTEELVTQIIDGAVAVHSALGPGLLERTYADAMTIELDYRGIKFEREREVALFYRGKRLKSHRIDLVVEGTVLLELKAVDRLAPIHQAQVLSYLKASNLRIGLLINFNANWIKGNIRRIIL
jgi:GxxExxY protein